MKLGQQAFFYHSNCKEPGIVALVKVSVCVLGRSDKEWVRAAQKLSLLVSQHQRVQLLSRESRE